MMQWSAAKVLVVASVWTLAAICYVMATKAEKQHFATELFEVDFPGRVSTTSRIPASHDVLQMTEYLHSSGQQGNSVAVILYRGLPDPTAAAQAAAANLGCKVESQHQAFVRSNLKAIEIRAADCPDNQSLLARTIEVENRLFVVTALFPTNSKYQLVAEKFVHSFRLRMDKPEKAGIKALRSQSL
jgi:hypothetical protein